jgi:glycine dehydrogenase subunit 1
VSFTSLTDEDRAAMLAAIGVESVADLFAEIPADVRLDRALRVDPALTEAELWAHLSELAARNSGTGSELSFLGAGVYDHYVPAVVDAVMQRGELLTAYTPYQPEMSQGTLQAIFEYQTAICELTGMDVSNASGYDGTTVAADACFVARQTTGRTKVVVAETLNPQVRQVVRTFAPGFGLEVVEVPHTGGTTDPERFGAACAHAACAIFPQPNFFGCLEPAPELTAAVAATGALPVAHVDLMTLGVLEAPGAYGCALAIGEGQSAGNHMSFGGPHFGFLAARSDYIRKLPGRIVGETTDHDGRRGFVLTLQTREQHIRREKATSNITTNQTLLAVAGLIYLSWLGPDGLRDVGSACLSLAEHAKRRLGLPLAFDRPTFQEFAVRLGRPAREVIREARELGVHPGYALGRDYSGMDDVLLVCLTEKRTAADIDRLAEVLGQVQAVAA